MNEKQMVQVSKRLSRHLRHAPEEIGLELGDGGWVSVAELLTALARHGFRVSRDELAEVVARNDKRRFAFDDSGMLIRASQGHSVAVELALPVAVPPAVLFHGTVAAALAAIRREGLRPMRRHHVHLSAAEETAVRVGARRGRPVVLRVDAARMVAQRRVFYVSANGVWLTDGVPPEYLGWADLA
ncbi:MULTISPECIES: RNA 2'-phosphotransferase [unclassified Crossiella]|uniref:RNA 2'-phosphotransferase n=1 Tax=unclassified Crossiella TaxID=2620835 RepID=UPI001FFFA185|nr:MULTISPECIES: RNA 2'-phosphotransferase [unclassified Crossiella]MCK2244037.1 RNA 2'-phosphotransferase [Crossiella sp. S99.2]MCK2257105.1 RNA 2'-phosphotransferase [Crossiella sp. S99.1]